MEKWILIGTNHAKKAPGTMLHIGMDLSRARLDVFATNDNGEVLAQRAWPPDADGLSSTVNC